MRGLILTGPLGVGKSTAQRLLMRDHAFWTPETITTRSVDNDETGMRACDRDAFVSAVRRGELVLPTHFASEWYAWSREDVSKLRCADGLAVLNVRPYTALTLAGMLPELIAVWLWAPADVLAARRQDRRLGRDVDETIRRIREAADEEDRIYEPLLVRRAEANAVVVSSLLAVLKR